MLYRLLPIQVFRWGFLVLFAMSLAAAGPGLAQPYDWLQSAGPEGGAVWTLAQAPNGDIFAGIWWPGGVFRSTDQGMTWQDTGLDLMHVSKIVVNNSGTVFAAGNGDVYRSKDNGGSWELSGSSLVSTFGSLACDPDLDILYAARYEKFSRSVDGGDSWEEMGTNFPSVDVQCLESVPGGGALFVGTMYNKVYRSDDGGVTWIQFADGIGSNGVTDFLLESGVDLFAASFGGGIYRTTVGGSTWTQIANGMEDFFCYAVGRDNPGRLWAGTHESGTFVSIDDGQNWSPGREGMGWQEIHDLLPLAGPVMLSASFGGGVYRTVDTGVWEPSNGGLNRTYISALLKAGSGTLFAATGGAGVHRSVDGGMTWSPANDGIEDPDVNDITEHPDGDLFCGTWLTHLYRSIDGGDTWFRTGSTPNIQRVGCMAVKASSGDLFVGGLFVGGVWRSTDKGDTWVAAGGGLPDDGTEYLVVEDDGDLLVVVNDHGIYRTQNDGATWEPINNGLTSLNVRQVLSLPGGVLFAAAPYFGLNRSVDDGASWQLVDSSLDDLKVTCVAANSIGFLFAGMADGGFVYQSTDVGDSWFPVSGSSFDVSLSCLAFNDNGNLLAGTDGSGVIYTDQTTPVQLRDFRAERLADGSVDVSWSQPEAASRLPGAVFRSVAGGPRELLTGDVLNEGPGFTFVDTSPPSDACEYWLRLTDAFGTHGWYGPVEVDKVGLVVTGLAIESVWPNPSAGTTRIRYSVPFRETARLDVFDLRGRLVRRLNKGGGSSGNLEAVWDTRDDLGGRVAAGTYFLRLSTDSMVVTGKVVVLGEGR